MFKFRGIKLQDELGFVTLSCLFGQIIGVYEGSHAKFWIALKFLALLTLLAILRYLTYFLNNFIINADFSYIDVYIR